MMDCPKKSACTESGCDKFHHKLLHRIASRNQSTPLNVPKLNTTAVEFKPRTDSGSGVEASHHSHYDNDVAVTAKVVRVRLYGVDGKYVDEYAYLDDGSSVTLMDRSVADALNLDGVKDTLKLRWTKGITRKEETLRCDVTVSGTGRERFILRQVYCVEDLDMAEASQNGYELTQRYHHLRNLPLPSFENVKPRILIGLEHANFLG